MAITDGFDPSENELTAILKNQWPKPYYNFTIIIITEKTNAFF